MTLDSQQPELRRYAIKSDQVLTRHHSTLTTIFPMLGQTPLQADPSHLDHLSMWPFLGASSVAALHSIADVGQGIRCTHTSWALHIPRELSHNASTDIVALHHLAEDR